MSGFQMEDCSEGGRNAGFSDAGDWLSWTVQVPSTAQVQFRARVASPSGGGSCKFEDANGKIIASIPTLPCTGGWQNWATITVTAIVAGLKTIYLRSTGSGFNAGGFL
ncbi:hypothetical protein ACA910_016655 [Epithemia clementina (nom. ined.)]